MHMETLMFQEQSTDTCLSVYTCIYEYNPHTYQYVFEIHVSVIVH